MQLIHRDTDIISGGNMISLLSFKNFPVFMGCVDTPPKDDLFTDMNWYISKETGMVQLNPIVDEKTIYMKPHGSGTVGKLWQDHHKEFADFVSSFAHGEIMEIGSSHGILYGHLQDKDFNWTIVEPNYFGPLNEKITVVPEFFNSNLNLNKKFGTIIHSHMFEHVLDLNDFFEGILKHTDKDSSMIFSVPNLDHILENNENFVLHFEHTYLLTDFYVKCILAMNGFEVRQQQAFKNHSTFYNAVYTGEKKLDFDFSKLYIYNISKILCTHLRLSQDVKHINNIVSSSDNECFLFGGHVFSQYLINLGLEQTRFKCILDNDKAKHGKRLYGTKLIVNSPSYIKDVKRPIVIVRAGVYRQEIEEQLIAINSECVFY